MVDKQNQSANRNMHIYIVSLNDVNKRMLPKSNNKKFMFCTAKSSMYYVLSTIPNI